MVRERYAIGYFSARCRAHSCKRDKIADGMMVAWQREPVHRSKLEV
jgi:uncharacterized phage-associated protein